MIEFPIEDEKTKIVLTVQNIVQSIDAFKELPIGLAEEVMNSVLQTEFYMKAILEQLDNIPEDKKV